MRVNSSYGECHFNKVRMLDAIQKLATHLPAFMEKYDFDTVAVTGKSGTAFAFALQLFVSGLQVVAIRKGESTHGDMVEGAGNTFTRYAVLDDFVSSGDTVRRIHDELCRKANAQEADMPELVGIVEYAKYTATGSDHEQGEINIWSASGAVARLAYPLAGGATIRLPLLRVLGNENAKIKNFLKVTTL